MIKQLNIIEVRWHGRGGQGTVTAASILAEAAFFQGYQGVISMPAFGAERRGAPVSASTRFSNQPIRVYSQIETPDAIVVLDETLLKYPKVTEGLKANGWFIVNSPLKPEELTINGNFNVATANCTSICRELGVMSAGLIVVNTAILGSFAKATELITMTSIQKALRKRFADPSLDVNIKAAIKTYDETILNARHIGKRERNGS